MAYRSARRAESSSVSRRKLLVLVASGVGVSLLAACGGGATATPEATIGTGPVSSAASTASGSSGVSTVASATSAVGSATAQSSATTQSATSSANAAAPTAAASAPASESGKLVFWNTTEGTKTGYEQGDKDGFLDYFRAKNPKVELEADYNSDVYTKYQQAAVAGTPPDVSFVSVSSVYDYAKKGYLTDLQPYANRSKLDLSNYYQVFFDALRYPSVKADLYAIPYEWVNTWLTYNKDLFQHAGIPFPDGTWSYDQFRDAASKLTDASRPQWGCTSYTGYTTPILGCMIPSNGGSFFSSDYRQCTFNSEENVASIQYLHDLMYASHAAPPPTTKAPDKGWFVRGQQAISMWNCCGDLGTDRQQKSLSWDVTANPKGSKGQFNVAWSNQYVISSPSRMKDAAWELLVDSIRPDRPPLTFGQGKAPIMKGAAKAWLDDQKNEPPANLKVYLDEQYLTQLVVGPSRGDWQKVIDQQVNDVMQNKVSAHDGVAEAAKAMQVVLDKAWSS